MKKLTKQEKINRGTYDPSKERQTLTFAPLKRMPNPTMDLNEIELQYFHNVCRAMLSNKTLTGADVPCITRACKMYSLYCRSLEDVNKFGAYQTTATGYTAKSGYFQVLIDTEKALQAFERSMGLNILSRSKLPTPAPEIRKNAFDKL